MSLLFSASKSSVAKKEWNVYFAVLYSIISKTLNEHYESFHKVNPIDQL